MFSSSTKRQIFHFHVVVVEGKEMYKKRAVRAKFLFCQSNQLLRPRYRFLGSS